MPDTSRGLMFAACHHLRMVMLTREVDTQRSLSELWTFAILSAWSKRTRSVSPRGWSPRVGMKSSLTSGHGRIGLSKYVRGVCSLIKRQFNDNFLPAKLIIKWSRFTIRINQVILINSLFAGREILCSPRKESNYREYRGRLVASNHLTLMA